MASMTKRAMRSAYVAGAAGIALVLAGCSSGSAGDTGGSTQKTAVFQMGSDPGVTNPVMSTGFADQQIGCVIFEGLTKSDDKGLPSPQLAKSWEVSQDGLAYTFHLVEANWSDGQPFTSDDVKFTYEQASSKYGPLWGDLSKVFVSVETPDPRTAIVHLSEPFAAMLLMTRCSHNGAILPKHIYEGVDLTSKGAGVAPVGTGAFTLGEVVPGQTYTLERNDDYWQEGLPHLDRVVGKIISSTASATSAIRAGEIDYMSPVAANAANQLEKVEGVKVEAESQGSASVQLLSFNTQREPFNNPDVRKALYQALDRAYIIDKVFFGRGAPGVSAMTSMAWAYTGDVDYNKMYPFDIEAAKKALDKAGFPMGANGTRFSVDFLVRNDPPERVELANVIKAMWAQIGVETNVRVTERAAENVDAFTSHNFDVNIQGYTNYGDPAAGTARAYICGAIGRAFGNVSQFCDPAQDELWAKAASATDVERRKEFYGQLDAGVAKALPSAVIQEYATDTASVSNLEVPYQAGSPDWAQAIFK
jgi:peptide/nickel transport system substrate-binding protein